MTAVQINFAQLNRSALPYCLKILSQWLPDGRRIGREYVARNPKRNDRRPGSFKVNLETGQWSDFATGDSGGDLISLAAYLADMDQLSAAKQLANMIGCNLQETAS